MKIEDLLQKAGVIQILLYLYDHPDLMRVEYRLGTGVNPRSQVAAHNLLTEAGFLERHFRDNEDHARFSLSPLGREVAEFLLKISEKIQHVNLPEEKQKEK